MARRDFLNYNLGGNEAKELAVISIPMEGDGVRVMVSGFHTAYSPSAAGCQQPAGTRTGGSGLPLYLGRKRAGTVSLEALAGLAGCRFSDRWDALSHPAAGSSPGVSDGHANRLGLEADYNSNYPLELLSHDDLVGSQLIGY